MTTEAVLVEVAGRGAPYPDAPPRDDMQNLIYIHWRSTVEALREHFGSPDTTFVGNEARLGPSLSAQEDTRPGAIARIAARDESERAGGYAGAGSDGGV